MKDLDFSNFEKAELPVKIFDKDYVLIEATGDAATRYTNMLMEATKLGPDGTAEKVTGIANANPFLLSLCLYELTPTDEEGGETRRKRVNEAFVRSLPNQIMKPLYEKVKEISHLNDDDTEKKWTVNDLIEYFDKLSDDGFGDEVVTATFTSKDEKLDAHFKDTIALLKDEEMGKS